MPFATSLEFCRCVLDCGHSRQVRRQIKANSHQVNSSASEPPQQIASENSREILVFQRAGSSLHRKYTFLNSANKFIETGISDSDNRQLSRNLSKAHFAVAVSALNRV